MQQLEHMETFVRVIEAGSFSAASDQLNLAKSAVSRRVAELEAHLGVRLLDRTTRRFRVTESGTLYLEHARGLLNQLKASEEAVRGADAALEGLLRVASPLNFGQLHLMPQMNRFMDKHPGVVLELDATDRRVDLVAEGMDLGVRLGSAGSDNLVARRFAPVRMVVVAAPSYLERMGEPSDLDDLEQNHYCVFNTNVPANVAWRFQLADGGTRVAQPRVRFRSNDGNMLLQAVKGGHGISLIPSFIAADGVRAGKLVQIMTGFRRPERDAMVVYPVGRPLSQRARAFIDFITRAFGSEPYWDEPFVF